MARRTLLEPEPERWSYVIHILMDSGRIMECEGIRTGTYDSIDEYADKLARDYNGSVKRLYARAIGEIPPPAKERVRYRSPEKTPVLALPSPPAAPTPAAPPHMTRVIPTARPTPKLLVHTSKHTSEN